MATLEGLEDLVDAKEQLTSTADAEKAAEPDLEDATAEKEVTNSPEDNSLQRRNPHLNAFTVAVTKLKLSPQDRNSFLQTIAFNANTYRTAFRNEDGRVLYQRLRGEDFVISVIEQNLDFIQENAIFPEFNFFIQPSLATADSTALLLLSNGLYVRGVFGRPNPEVELDPNAPAYYIDLKDENGEIVQERCGLSAVVAINTRFDLEKVPVITKEQYETTPVKLIYDTAENAKRYRLSPAEQEKRRRLETHRLRRRAKVGNEKRARRANRKK